MLLLLALPLLAACGGSPTTVVDPAGGPTTSSLPPEQVVVRVYDGPGFTSAIFAGRTFATLTVLGDGRVFEQGPVPDIFPGPAVLPVLTGTLTSAQLAQVIADIKQADLLRTVDYGRPPVSDAGTVDVSVDVDGHTWIHSAYALNIGSAEQSPERRTLSAFIASVHKIVDPVATHAYEPMALVATAWQAAPQPGQTPGPKVKPWSGATPLGTGSCQVVSDPALVRELAGGTETTLYRQGGTTYQLGLRPLLPGDKGCAPRG